MNASVAATTDQYRVIGNPIAHSKSPDIHAAFARETGEAIMYERLLAPLDGFEAAVRAFIDEGGRGANVTVPFKLVAFLMVDRLTPRAQAAGAVNTLAVHRDAQGAVSIEGDNTDGAGLVRDIESNLACPLAGKRILLIGAGGAVRGVLQPLFACGPAQIDIVNRTTSRAVELQTRFADMAASRGVALQVLASEGFGAGVQADALAVPYDVIINGTSSSLADTLPPMPAGAIGAHSLVYDMMYGAEPTVFLRAAAEAGARTADGLGMLVEQAAEAFFVWRGVRPSAAPVLAALRADLAQAARATQAAIQPSATRTT